MAKKRKKVNEATVQAKPGKRARGSDCSVEAAGIFCRRQLHCIIANRSNDDRADGDRQSK